MSQVPLPVQRLKEVLSGPELEAEYGLTLPWQRKKRRLGDGPPYLKIGKMVKYRRADMEAYLTAQLIGPRREAQK